MPDRACQLCTLLGRILLSSIFVMSGIHKITAWAETVRQMENEGMPLVSVLLVGAIVLELGGGLLVLLGWWTRLGAALLILFLIPTTLVFHDFWTYEGAERQMQMINFMKNLAILGGLFLASSFGPGPVSFDHRRVAPAGSQGSELTS